MTRRSTSAWFALVTALLIVALLVAGIALAFKKGALATPGGPVGSAVAQLTAPSGLYREGLVGTPTMLNPLLATAQSDRDLTALIFSGLTRTDGRGGVLPDLAKSWTIDTNGTRYLFTLRDDVTWQDGQRFTASDVLFTLQLVQDAGFTGDGTLADFWRTVKVEAPDDLTVVFTLPNVYAPFLGFTNLGILPRHLLGDVKAVDLPGHPFNLKPVGTGAFSFGVLDSAKVEISLTRYAGFYGAKPQLAGLAFKFYSDTPSALRGLQAGEVDGLGYVPARYLGETAAAIGNRASIYGPSIAGYTAMFLNLKAPVFASRDVRQALARAIDRDKLVQQGLSGWGTPGSSPILPTSWAYSTAGVPTYPYNPDAARQALDQAGWRAGPDGTRAKAGQTLGFTLLTDNDPARVAVATLLAEQLNAVGAKVLVQALSADEVAQALALRRYEAALSGWAGLASDPDPYQMWHSSQSDTGYNFANYGNPRVDDVLAQARVTTNRDQRAALYATFQQLFAEDQPSYILYYPQYHFVVTNRVKGVSLDPLDVPSDRFRNIAEWTMSGR